MRSTAPFFYLKAEKILFIILATFLFSACGGLKKATDTPTYPYNKNKNEASKSNKNKNKASKSSSELAIVFTFLFSILQFTRFTERNIIMINQSINQSINQGLTSVLLSIDRIRDGT